MDIDFGFQKNLMEASYKEYFIMNRTTIEDPEGGEITGWAPGVTVKMALDDPTQTQKMMAQQQKVDLLYTANFPVGSPVMLGNYLRSKDDPSLTYYVQNNPVQNPNPASAIQTLKADVIRKDLPK